MLSIILITYLLHVGLVFYKVDFPVFNVLLFVYHTSLLINALLSNLILLPYFYLSLSLLNSLIIFVCVILILCILFLIIKILSSFKKLKWIETYFKDL